MDNKAYLREVISNAKGNVSLVNINAGHFREGFDFAIKGLLKETKKPIIIITFTNKGEELVKKYGERVVVVDAFSEKKSKNRQVINIGEEISIPKIEIGIDKALEKTKGKGIIVFDSIGGLSIYNTQKRLGKFIYLFNNKIKLLENSLLFFIINNSVNEDTLNMIKQFVDKTYDFSKLYVSAIEKNN